MNTRLLACLLLGCAVPGWGHRLDEYLQAVRVAVSSNQVELSVDLTPGVAVLDRLRAVLDPDRDGVVRETERVAYLTRFLKELRVEVDDNPVALHFVSASFPTMARMQEGVGIIHLKAAGAMEPLKAGAHTLTLTNAHLPDISVYLVNALVPTDPAIEITKQARDELQKHYRLEFGVAVPAPPPKPREKRR